jgi:predicted ester cyclase
MDLAICKGDEKMEEEMDIVEVTDEYDNVHIVTQYTELLTADDVAAAEEYLGEDSTVNRERLDAFRKYFPDMEVEIQETIADGDDVVQRAVITGTHNEDYYGIPASHEAVEISGLIWYHLENGKIMNQWVEFNVADSYSNLYD